MGGRSIFGMMSGKSGARNAAGASSDSTRYLLAVVPGFRVAARAPTPARSGPRPPGRPIAWQVVHWPFSRKIFSPAAVSCSGVTFPPSSDSSSGGFDSIWGIELAYQV